jgi:hypothetical protein
LDPLQGAGASPATEVHLDYSSTGARIHLRKFYAKLAEAGCEVIVMDEKMLANGMSKAESSKGYDGPRWAKMGYVLVLASPEASHS